MKQDFSRNYISMAGSLYGSEKVDESGNISASGEYFKIGNTSYLIKTDRANPYITVNNIDYNFYHISKILCSKFKN